MEVIFQEFIGKPMDAIINETNFLED